MTDQKATVQPTTTFEKCSVVLVDVLGTTTSINFAKDTLFPFVTKNVEEVLKEKWEEDSIKKAVKQLKEGDEEIDQETSVKLVKELTENESDNAGLKVIQGLIYGKGYASGDLKSHVFDDVPEAFETWAKARKVAVFSTGSVDSQKQLFSNTTLGDLSAHISQYFDQDVGSKKEEGSYKKIVEKLDVKPEEVVFLTDVIEEAKAAKAAGLCTVLVSREGNGKLPEDLNDFLVIKSFKEISFENPAKRKNMDDLAVPEAEPPTKVAKIDPETIVKEQSPEQATQEEKKPVEKPKSTEKIEDEAMEVDEVKPDKNKESESDETQDTSATKKTEDKPEKTEETPVVISKLENVPNEDQKVVANPEKTEDTTEIQKDDSAVCKDSAIDEKDAIKETEKEPKETDKVEECKKEVKETQEVKPTHENGVENLPDKQKEPEVEGEKVAANEVDDAKSKKEEEEEKENKKDLANGLEKEEEKADLAQSEENAKDEPTKTNGDVVETPTDIEGTVTAKDVVLAKEVEASPATSDAPEVTVEV